MTANKEYAKFFEYHYVFEGEHGETIAEGCPNNISLAKAMKEIMKEARVSNADYVYWEGLYKNKSDWEKGKKTYGHKKLTDIALKLDSTSHLKAHPNEKQKQKVRI